MKAHDVDWSTMRLGRRPDREVAEELGCNLETVKRARRALGFAASGAPKPTTALTDWSKVVFGKEPDAELAERLGCSVITVTKRRQDLGIAAFVPAPVYRWLQYAACAECGVDASERCMDMDNSDAVHPCLGRSLMRGAHGDKKAGICPQGHRIAGTNARPHRGGVECRECHNRRANEYQRRRRAAAKDQKAAE